MSSIKFYDFSVDFYILKIDFFSQHKVQNFFSGLQIMENVSKYVF